MAKKSTGTKLTEGSGGNSDFGEIDKLNIIIAGGSTTSGSLGGLYIDRGYAEYTGRKESEILAYTTKQEEKHNLLCKLKETPLSGIANVKMHSSGEIVCYLKKGVKYNEAELGLIVAYLTNHTATVEQKTNSQGFFIVRTKAEIEVPKTDITHIIQRMDAALQKRTR